MSVPVILFYVFAVLAVACVWRTWDVYNDVRIGRGDALGGLVQMVPIIAAYVWTACESLRYYAMMRRRLRLGIGDPAVCDRFLLCGAMALCATSGIALNAVALALGVETYSDAGILMASSVSGLGQAVLMVLAFAPPRSYLAWVETRARAMAV